MINELLDDPNEHNNPIHTVVPTPSPGGVPPLGGDE